MVQNSAMREHISFKTQELSNIVWGYAVLSSEGLLGNAAADDSSPWKPAAMLDAGDYTVFHLVALK